MVRELAYDFVTELDSSYSNPPRRITCTEIFERCSAYMDDNWGFPESGWMKFTYDYAAHILYPEDEFTKKAAPYAEGAIFFLEVLRLIFNNERENVPFDPMMDFAFLTDEEARQYECALEYRSFKKFFRNEYIYEMMRLGIEVTSFNTLNHIAGVHHVAMTVAKGLKEAGIPVDLSLVSGAAAGHDVGKFGCKPGEKVPFLHYYYTDNWFKRHNIHYIGHIAANHSTWDLEPEYLTVEALILIYADYRVKQSRDANGVECTRISTLSEAFNIILKKLFNVDEAKLNRYKFVYSRLQDFEDYMRYHGVDVDLNGHTERPPEMPYITLRNPEQTIRSLVFMNIEDNIHVMNKMGAERHFGDLLEAARSEKNWRNIRAYLNVLREFFPNTNHIQKEQILEFLYELFMNPEGDIRRQAARLMGRVFAMYNSGYRKALPAGIEDSATTELMSLWDRFLEMMILPDHKLTDVQKSRIRYQLKNVLGSICRISEGKERRMFLDHLLNWFRNPNDLPDGACFSLLDCLFQLQFDLLTDDELILLASFAMKVESRNLIETKISAWRIFNILARHNNQLPIIPELVDYVRSVDVTYSHTLTFLKFRIFQATGNDFSEEKKHLSDPEVVSDIFLDNLKSTTPWVYKLVNIKLLTNEATTGNRENILHIATHFSNLIKVSEHVIIRSDAGDALLRIIPLMTPDQRNEIVIELLKGLQVGEYAFSKYIPKYLGICASWLPPAELDEIVMQLENLISSPNEKIVSGAIDTASVLLTAHQNYRERFPETEEKWAIRRERMLGILLYGLADYRSEVRQESIYAFGQGIFSRSKYGNTMTADEKYHILTNIYKKLLYFLNEHTGKQLTEYYRAAALTNICRFITEYTMTNGGIKIPERDKIAFFSGTFDPFTLSHKGIAKTIRDMGFEVYLQVDEFAWSKRAQPQQIRRQIVNMSIAGITHINVFPYQIPLYLGNDKDMVRLKELFPDKEVYMVVGSDVIAHASFYNREPVPGSIQDMNTIAFRRVGDTSIDLKKNPELRKRIAGHVIELELPEELEEISSTRIRENIDLNRDISNLIDPNVQEYIYNNGFYLREPEFKPLIRARAIAFEESLSDDSDIRVLKILNTVADNRISGYIRYRYITPSGLFNELKSIELADRVRKHTSGNILMISEIKSYHDPMIKDAEQLLLSEAIGNSLRNNCSFSIFYSEDHTISPEVESVLMRQGYLKSDAIADNIPLYLVDMKCPLVLMQNMETALKEPFCSNERVLKVLRKAHRNLQTVMTRIYPGQLVLSLSANIIYHRLVTRITELNEVPREPVVPRKLGKNMCVPYGKILRGGVIPNTTTKTLHTDKYYDPEFEHYHIKPFLYYSDLETQMRILKSFNKPVILVDDVLHDGGRFEALEPLIKKEGIEIKRVLLGALSGYGKDSMAIKGIDCESVYFIPNLRQWLVESTLYPFIGGDSVERDSMKIAGLTPSVNMILPYTLPQLEDCTTKALYDFSECCIQNARDIFIALENEYRSTFSRNLTLSRLSEAVNLPLCPDRGDCVNYNPNLTASEYLENDLQMLRRSLKKMI